MDGVCACVVLIWQDRSVWGEGGISELLRMR